ncbi:hypothetical protein DLJ74_05500 [Gracilibacillus dipsosauri]|uniref:Uncharacterized protein n=1 Tax=Gracilibacillus dipsosauri TaxID=178340 RepID=A0A317L0U0_9BACI|nr:hypothetical protein DLJ74_05500 [Gracilibacillus dipsosauri]
MLKRKNMVFIIPAIFLVLMITVFYFNNTQKVYGNNKESIVKVIKSIDGYESKSIDILIIKDLNDVRVVGFLSNGSPAYIQFIKNSEGNYEWEYIEEKQNEKFSSFIPKTSNTENLQFMFVTNDESKVAKMQVSVNGKIVEQEFIPNKASVTWTDLPQSDESEYSFRNYKYYDEDGNLIKK